MKRPGLVAALVSLLVVGCVEPAPPTTADAPDFVPMTKLVKPKVETDDSLPTGDAEQKVDAEQVLAKTLATAKADNKRVLVHLGAPW